MVDGPPEIVSPTFDLHEHLVQVPTPLSDLAHLLPAASLDLLGKQRPGPVDLFAHTLMADIDSVLMQQVFHISK